MTLFETFLQQMQHATFAFAIDGKTDMMSLNPLEMTNFEMMGAIFGVAGLAITFILSRVKAGRQEPHRFVLHDAQGARQD